MTTTQYFGLVAMVALALFALASAAEAIYHWLVNTNPISYIAFVISLVAASFSGAGAIFIGIAVLR